MIVFGNNNKNELNINKFEISRSHNSIIVENSLIEKKNISIKKDLKNETNEKSFKLKEENPENISNIINSNNDISMDKYSKYDFDNETTTKKTDNNIFIQKGNRIRASMFQLLFLCF